MRLFGDRADPALAWHPHLLQHAARRVRWCRITLTRHSPLHQRPVRRVYGSLGLGRAQVLLDHRNLTAPGWRREETGGVVYELRLLKIPNPKVSSRRERQRGADLA
jgi:hypothetical protein